MNQLDRNDTTVKLQICMTYTFRERIRSYCDEKRIVMGEYIRNLIKADLKLK